MSEHEHMLFGNGSVRCNGRKRKRKRERKRSTRMTTREDDDDDMYHPSQDYNDDSLVDPEFRPTKRELKEADKEGDS